MNFDLNNFLFSLDTSHTILLIILAIALVYTFIRYIGNSYSGNHPYHSQQYWEGRYSLISKRMDWYIPFQQIRVKFKLDGIFEKQGNHFKKWKVLDLGCGNSTLPIDVRLRVIKLVEYGFKNVFAIDFSQSVISEMKKNYSDYPVVCKEIL